MDLDNVRSDLISLRKLYGLLHTKQDDLRNKISEINQLDDKARLLLKNLLDGAAAAIFEVYSEIVASPLRLPKLASPSIPKTAQDELSDAIPKRVNARKISRIPNSKYRTEGFEPKDEDMRVYEHQHNPNIAESLRCSSRNAASKIIKSQKKVNLDFDLSEEVTKMISQIDSQLEIPGLFGDLAEKHPMSDSNQCSTTRRGSNGISGVDKSAFPFPIKSEFASPSQIRKQCQKCGRKKASSAFSPIDGSYPPLVRAPTRTHISDKVQSINRGSRSSYNAAVRTRAHILDKAQPANSEPCSDYNMVKGLRILPTRAPLSIVPPTGCNAEDRSPKDSRPLHLPKKKTIPIRRESDSNSDTFGSSPSARDNTGSNSWSGSYSSPSGSNSDSDGYPSPCGDGSRKRPEVDCLKMMRSIRGRREMIPFKTEKGIGRLRKFRNKLALIFHHHHHYHHGHVQKMGIPGRGKSGKNGKIVKSAAGGPGRFRDLFGGLVRHVGRPKKGKKPRVRIGKIGKARLGGRGLGRKMRWWEVFRRKQQRLPRVKFRGGKRNKFLLPG